MMRHPLSIAALSITVLALETIAATPANAAGFNTLVYDISFSGDATLHEAVSAPFPATPQTVGYENESRQGTVDVPVGSEFPDVLDVLFRTVHEFDPFSYGNNVTFSGEGHVDSNPYSFEYTNNHIAFNPPIDGNTCITHPCNFTADTTFSVSDPTTANVLIDGKLSYSGGIEPIPTPALLPGLLGLGVSVWRKRRSAVASPAQSSADCSGT
jgi:hypothetical protein